MTGLEPARDNTIGFKSISLTTRTHRQRNFDIIIVFQCIVEV